MALYTSNEEQLQEAQKQTAAPQQKLGSGTFTNLQQYLKSNVGAGQRIAGKIGEDVAKKSEAATAATTEAQNVGKAIQAQRDRASQAGGIVKDIQSVASGSTPISGLAGKEEEAKYFTSGEYAKQAEAQKGQLSKTAATAGQAVGALGQRAEALGTEKGRYNLLSDVYRGHSYGAGSQRLDQLLLQQQGAGALSEAMRKSTTQAAQQKAAIAKSLETGTAGLSDILSKGGQAATDILGAASKGLETLEQAEEAQRKAKETEQSDLYEKLKTGFQGLKADASGNVVVSPELQGLYKQATGQDLTGGQDIYNLLDNPAQASNWIQKQTLAQNAYVSKEDLDKMNLLSRLGGGISTKYTEAGTSPTNLLGGSFEDAAKIAQGQFMKEAAAQTFKGEKRYTTGQETAGGYTGALLGSPTNTSYGYQTASSTVADYLKDPSRLSQTFSINPEIQRQRTNALDQYKNLEQIIRQKEAEAAKTGMSFTDKDAQDIRKSILQNVALAERSYEQEAARVGAEQELQSQIKDYLSKKGYGRRLVLGI